MRKQFVIAVTAMLALSAPTLAHTWPKRHHTNHAVHPSKRNAPRANDEAAPNAETRRRQNDCSNDDCRGINSSNGIGGSGGF